MYLEIFLADFAVFRVFLGISRDFDRAKYQKPRLEQELMKFLVQKGKIPYAWQEALISTSAVSIVYYITCIFFACMDKELFCENVHADYWVLLNLIY